MKQDLAKHGTEKKELGAGLSLRFTPLLRSFAQKNASRSSSLHSLHEPPTIFATQKVAGSNTWPQPKKIS